MAHFLVMIAFPFAADEAIPWDSDMDSNPCKVVTMTASEYMKMTRQIVPGATIYWQRSEKLSVIEYGAVITRENHDWICDTGGKKSSSENMSPISTPDLVSRVGGVNSQGANSPH